MKATLNGTPPQSNGRAKKHPPKDNGPDIIAALGPSGVMFEYSSRGVRFVSDHPRSNGVIECYGALRNADSDSKPSAYVDVTTGKYKDSGGDDTREINLWEFIAKKTGGDWIDVKRGLAERFGLAGGNGKAGAKRPPHTATVTRTAAPQAKPAEDWHVSLGLEDWTEGKKRLLKWWCVKHRPGIDPETVIAAGGRVAKYPLGRTNRSTGEAIDVPTDYVVAIPVYGPEGLRAGPTAWVAYKLNGKPFSIYRGKDPTTGEKLYDEVKMKSIGSTDGVIGEPALRMIESGATFDLLLKVEGPTDGLAVESIVRAAGQSDRIAVLSFAGTATQANPWMAELFRGQLVAVIHDADKTGEKGALKACALIAATAREVRHVRLPYPVEVKSGKDLRDWVVDGGDWPGLSTMIEAAEPFDASTAPEPAADGDKAGTTEETPQLPLASKVDPSEHADAYLARRMIDDAYTVVHSKGSFYQRRGGCFRQVKDEEINASILSDIAKEHRFVTSSTIHNVGLHIKSRVMLPGNVQSPAWVYAGPPGWDPKDVLPFPSELIHLPSYVAGIEPYRIKNTAGFFTTTCLSYEFADDPPQPTQWISFLDQVFEGELESIALLREWMGYCLTHDTSQQKIMLLIGPPRSGKGTIARVIRELLGQENTISPSLAGIGERFGLEPLIDKPLATFNDVRLTGRADSAAITERLLSISGEDAQTIDRKHRDTVTLTLPTRLMIISNELPRLGDSSGALVSRLLVLRARQSFIGHEDSGLTGKLLQELPGILLWAIGGWHRLRSNGRFQQPKSSTELVDELDELVSPVLSFVREKCVVHSLKEISVSDLYEAWCVFCRSNGIENVGSSAIFGRNLLAAVPSIRRIQPREGNERYRAYKGIGKA